MVLPTPTGLQNALGGPVSTLVFGAASPRLLLKAMENPGNVRGVVPQRLGNRFLPTVSFNDGGTTFFVLFDPTTNLPAAIRTRDDDNIFGDSNYDLVLDQWTDVAGARVAKLLSY